MGGLSDGNGVGVNGHRERFFAGLMKCTKCGLLTRHLTASFFPKNMGVWQGL